MGRAYGQRPSTLLGLDDGLVLPLFLDAAAHAMSRAQISDMPESVRPMGVADVRGL